MLNLIIIVLGLLAAAGGVALSVKAKANGEKARGFTKALVAVGLLVAVFGGSFVIIPTGYTGVRSVFGQVDQTPMSPGFNWIIPIVQNVERVNNKQQDIQIATADKEGPNYIWGESKDKVQVYMADVTITYQISPDRAAWIHANVSDYKNNLVSHDLVASALKNATKQLTTYDVTTRSAVEPLAAENVQRMIDEKYGEGTILIVKVVINDMNFEDTYNEAVEQKNIAMQRQEQQAIENQTNIDKANAEAESARIAAEGRAVAAIAEAEGIAEANRLVAESLTPEILQQGYIDAIGQWRPYVIGGDGAYPTFTLPTPEAAPEAAPAE